MECQGVVRMVRKMGDPHVIIWNVEERLVDYMIPVRIAMFSNHIMMHMSRLMDYIVRIPVCIYNRKNPKEILGITELLRYRCQNCMVIQNTTYMDIIRD